MTDYVKKIATPSDSGDTNPWSGQLNVILTIGQSAFVDQIQSFKANDLFETIFQPQTAENFNSMNLIRICKDLYCKFNGEYNMNPYDNNSIVILFMFLLLHKHVQLYG